VRRAALAGVAGLALLLPGCLGEDDEEPLPAPVKVSPVEEDPEQDPGSDAVIAVIEEAAATRNGDACDRLATLAYLQQREHRRGIAALDACQDGVFDRDRGLLDGPVQVGDVRIGPNAAVATVYLQGDGYAGLTARVRLVPKWRLDRIESFVEPQRRQLERLLRSELVAGQLRFRPGAAECALVEAGRLSDRDLEKALLAPSPDRIYGLVLRCAKDDAVALAARDLPPGLSKLPKGLEACARKRLAAAPDPHLIQVMVDHDRTGAVDALVACDRAGVLAAYRKELTSPPLSMPARQGDCVIRSLSGLPPDALVRVFTDEGIEARVASCASGEPQ
jgi:hypothetical protein